MEMAPPNVVEILNPTTSLGILPSGIFRTGAILVLPVLAFILYGFYNAFLHPLRHYPGPIMWRAFRFPYVFAIHGGYMHQKLKRYHDKYGLVVRIAPNELSYADGGAWKDIYASRPGHQPFPRNPTWFKKMTPDEPHSIVGFNEEAHARARRTFVHSFSEKSLRDQSPVIERYVELFMSQLKSPVSGRTWKEKTVDLTAWFNYLSFDITGDLSFGESFDCLANGRAHPWVEIVQDFGKSLSLVASVNLYPPIHRLLRHVIPQKIRQRNADHRKMSAAKARERLALDIERPDFVTAAKKYSDQKSVLSDKEWEINMMVLVFAGSETTSSSLTAVTRELVQHPGVLHRLTREIRTAFARESDITIAASSNLPYLNAVINEGLRLDPAVVIGFPRIVPPKGDVVCEKWVPGGTYVTFNQFPANRQAKNFRHPNSFIPERFLNPTPETDDMSTFLPFGTGRHSCIGMKLAYAEMRVTLARLLFNFDISLANQSDRWDWGDQKTYILWEKRPLQVTLKPSIGQLTD